MCKPFIDYLNSVDELLETQYGVTAADVGVDSDAASQEAEWTPEEHVEWIGKKYELTRLEEIK